MGRKKKLREKLEELGILRLEDVSKKIADLKVVWQKVQEVSYQSSGVRLE